MECPRCNQTLERIDRRVPGRPDPKRIFYCEHCGWGKDQLEQKVKAQAPDSGPTPDAGPPLWLKLSGLWALSLAIMMVPYVLILQIPGLFSSAYPDLFDAQHATTRMAEALNPTYWVVMAMYIGLCGLFQTPNVDRSDPFPIQTISTAKNSGSCS